MVALVAALAALAVAGRLVLAPVPNVVATTDVALITGYALGARARVRRRRAGGAGLEPVAGPGPLDALADGGLGHVRPARARCWPWPAGAAWAAWAWPSRARSPGFAYGALLDLSVMVSYGGEQSLDRYLALSARGIPFNVAHAVGNFAIALAAGPALVRMISRFRERSEFTWRPAAAAVPALLVALVALGSVAPAPAEAAGPAGARGYLERQQNSDGGFGATPTASSNLDMTAWAMLGMEASGRNPLDLRAAGSQPGRLPPEPPGDVHRRPREGDPGAGRGRHQPALVRGARPGRRAARQALRQRLVGRLRGSDSVRRVRPAGRGVPPSELGALGRPGCGRPRTPTAAGDIEPGSFSTPDSTGSALQALALVGGRSARSRGVDYLRRAQGG